MCAIAGFLELINAFFLDRQGSAGAAGEPIGSLSVEAAGGPARSPAAAAVPCPARPPFSPVNSCPARPPSAPVAFLPAQPCPMPARRKLRRPRPRPGGYKLLVVFFWGYGTKPGGRLAARKKGRGKLSVIVLIFDRCFSRKFGLFFWGVGGCGLNHIRRPS